MKHNIHFLHGQNPQHIFRMMQEIGSDEGGIALMAPKGQTLLIRIDGVNLKAANIIKQEMLSRGGDAAVHRDVSMLTKDLSSVLLVGTRRQIREFARKCRSQPFGLKILAAELEQALQNEERSWRRPIRNLRCRELQLTIGERTLIMGILNVTPDSFSDGGKFTDIKIAVDHAKSMIAAGADMIDIGGESTRPGAKKISLEEELERVIPVIRALTEANLGVPISIDTYKAEVARQALEQGAHIVNDVTALRGDADMAAVVAQFKCPVIIMHNRDDEPYECLLADVIRDLRTSIQIAHQAGISDELIILDPGIGFAKSYEQNLQLLQSLKSIVDLGYPVVLGTSRKRVVRHTIDADVDDCVEGTAATVALGIAQGCQIMRVHDIKEMKRVALMSDAIVSSNRSRN